MATNYGLLNNMASGIKEAMTAYQTTKQQERQQQQFNLLQGAQIGEDGNLAYTPEKQKELEQDRQFKQSQIEMNNLYKGQGILNQQAQITNQKAGLLGRGITFDDQGNPILSPEEKAKKEIDAAKSRAEIGKLQADAEKSRKEALQKDNPQSKLSGDIRQKLGYIDSVSANLDKLAQLGDEGQSKSYISSSTPFIGGMLSDKPADIATRQAAENYGRLQSGGAISKEEEARFMDMLPRPGDSKEIKKQKIEGIKRELDSKRKIYVGGDSEQPLTRGIIQKQQNPSIDPDAQKYSQMHGIPLDQASKIISARKAQMGNKNGQ